MLICFASVIEVVLVYIGFSLFHYFSYKTMQIYICFISECQCITRVAREYTMLLMIEFTLV